MSDNWKPTVFKFICKRISLYPSNLYFTWIPLFFQCFIWIICIFRLLSLKISRNHFIKIGWNWSYSFLSISEFLEIDDSATGFFCAICFWYRISSEQFQCLVSMQTFLKIVERWQTFSKNCCVVVFWISIFYLNLMSLSNCLSAVSSRDLKMEFGFSLSLWRLFVLPEENRA